MVEFSNQAEMTPQRNTEFDGKNFTAILSSAPEGFKVSTKRTIGRTEDNSHYPLETPEEKNILGGAVKGETKFQGADKVRSARMLMRSAADIALDASMSGATSDVIANLDIEASEATNTFEEERHDYTKGMMGKIGFRDISVDEKSNTIHVNVKSVPFPTYKVFANPEDSSEIKKLSRAVGTAMVVRTANNKFIIQHRSSRNASYGDVPGASVAGMLDATIDNPTRKKGMPDSVDTDLITANILKEADEELGLDKNDLETVRIVGIADDKIKLHDELLLLADSPLNYNEIKQKAKSANRNRKLGDADFEEKFIAIDATPQAVETLLTEVHCPIPPTHAGNLVAAGYSLVLQNDGLAVANAWRDRLEKGVQANYSQIDQIVSNYYETNTDALTDVPDRYKGKHVPQRNAHAYTPAYLPSEQGLPTFEEEMLRTGLIQESSPIQ